MENKNGTVLVLPSGATDDMGDQQTVKNNDPPEYPEHVREMIEVIKFNCIQFYNLLILIIILIGL